MGNLPPGALLDDRMARVIIDKNVVIHNNKIYVYNGDIIIYTIYGYSEYNVEGIIENVSLEWIDHPTSWCFCILFCQQSVRLHQIKIKLKNYATITMYSIDGWYINTGIQ